MGKESDTSSTASDHMAGLFYLGNLKAIKSRLLDVTINNDDRRTVEFKAPILSQQANAGKTTYIVKQELENLFTALATSLPANKDPYLSELPTNEIKYVDVGLKYFRYLRLVSEGKDDEASSILKEINVLAPDFLKETKKTL